MNASIEQVQDTAVPSAQTPLAAAVSIQVNHDKLQAIQNSRIQEAMAREAELLERIAKLSELPDENERERQDAILNADLAKVRALKLKYQEDVGVLATELFALYDELGMKSTDAQKDTAEDIARREAANQAIRDAVAQKAKEEVNLATAQKALTDATALSDLLKWINGKEAKVSAAETAITTAETAITKAQTKIEEAEATLTEVEAQIEIDKRERVRKSSLAENFALIRQFTSDAITALKADHEATKVLIERTKAALNSALTKKRETAKQLDGVRDEIGTTERDLNRERDALDEIPDHGSSVYAEQQAVVAELENKLADLKGQELGLNTTHMAMTQAITANQSSQLGLRVQAETTDVFIKKLTYAEKTAEILGRNINQMVINTQQEVAADALDRVTDSMTATAVKLGIQAEVASAKARNNAIKRHDELMEHLVKTRDTGDQAIAIEAQRYLELDQAIRQGYKDRGVDLEMSHLTAAMQAATGGKVEDKVDDVTY